VNNLKAWKSLEGKWKGRIYQKHSKEPYQFDDQPEHNPKGFKRFVKRASKVLGEQEYKLGNVLYNERLQRWMLVDVRVE
jgi:hypothetical protein